MQFGMDVLFSTCAKFQFGGQVERRRRETRIEAPTWDRVWRGGIPLPTGAVPPPNNFFLIFMSKW